MSFKIICNICDNEVILKNNFEPYGGKNTIEIDGFISDKRKIIKCVECGNEIVSK